ncbi:MAG: hypothetical protein AAGA35_03645 [Patescibacteria group bacterium]
MKATITIIDTQTHFFIALFGTALLLSACLYIYFVSAAVGEVVLRKEMIRDVSALKSEIAKLEADYMAAQHVVSEHIASNGSYLETTSKVFVSRSDSSLVAVETDN